VKALRSAAGSGNAAMAMIVQRLRHLKFSVAS